MPINNREIIEAVSIIADNHNIKVTVKHSLKASFIVGGTTFLGSIMMGPLGNFVNEEENFLLKI